MSLNLNLGGRTRTPRVPRTERVRSAHALNPGVALSALVVLLLIVAALWPGIFTSQDPIAGDPADAFAGSSAAHILGTDQLGRDLFSRIIHGTIYSLSLGVGASLIGLIGGVILGVLAGYSRGIWDRVITRALDVLLAFPEVLVALLTITILGPGQWSLLWAVGLGRIPGAARLVRTQVLQIRGSGFIRSGIALGLSPGRLILRHVVPNSLGPVLVHAVIGVGVCIIFGAALSFLGLGAVPPTPEWGLMLSEARQYLSIAPWIAIWPGVFITLTVISVTVTGRWLQQRFISKRSSL
ncbi:peptide/nickel transport system permease protein [Mycetocola sp. BIGb0189]|uniref:ABC transporter permease n=1 Tax=Mycetocola sp. BIGb0189 TaxID=2940604 RepID=UPI002168CB97|nr:ABC transporter permease [Mycetocola sp. BIGb0189]MCS4275107.1 peptide/nickel transport system permease protein [Mycetocola sp. BIGb0189]